ncbi:hypothetical protein ABIE50_001660 [Chitinophaga sp. OAE865]
MNAFRNLSKYTMLDTTAFLSRLLVNSSNKFNYQLLNADF